MAVPAAPPPIEQFGPRPFSFYPPIGNLPHNEWLYQRATWSDIFVRNTTTGQEIAIPRALLGAISGVDDPVMTVRLSKAMEYREGALRPTVRRVIEMPAAVQETPLRPAVRLLPREPAQVVGIRTGEARKGNVGRVLLAGTSVAIVACALVASLYRGEIIGNRIAYPAIPRAGLGLTNRDGYAAVVARLGTPARNAWKMGANGLGFLAMTYPDKGLSIILMGRGRDTARYIGAIDKNGRPVDAVELPANGNSYWILRPLGRF